MAWGPYPPSPSLPDAIKATGPAEDGETDEAASVTSEQQQIDIEV
jgi:hypothetical protein